MSQFNVGDKVAYVRVKGEKALRKFAIVTATPESLTEGTSLTLAEGHVAVAIFSPTGNVYGRTDIPTKDIFDAAQAAGENETSTDWYGFEISGPKYRAFVEAL
jgi:hypothetical protein